MLPRANNCFTGASHGDNAVEGTPRCSSKGARRLKKGVAVFQLLVHPIADLRPLLPDVDAKRLARPLWPTPAAEQDFLRSSGMIWPRLQGGTEEWAGEDNFADAALAFRLPDRLRLRVFGADETACTMSHIFRRFYSSGIVCRFEIGFRVRRARTEALAAANTAFMLATTSCVPTRVRRLKYAQPLVAIGADLSRQYLHSTSNRKSQGELSAWWVVAGKPAMIVEYDRDDAIAPPPHARVVSSARVGATVLHHVWLEIAERRVSCWMLRCDDPASRTSEFRKLRIHLVRLHCERECLRLVLEAASRQQLASTLPQADELDDYLEGRLPLLTKPVSYGVEQSQLLEAAKSAWDAVLPGQSASFGALAQKTAKKVARYIRRSETAASVVTQIIGTQMNTHIQLGNVTVSGDFNLVTAENIQNSFNKAAGAPIEEDLKEALKTLTTQTAELAKHLPAKAAETVSKDLATLTAEAVSTEPRKAWYEISAKGLVDAAKTVVELAAPVTAAVGAVLALIA